MQNTTKGHQILAWRSRGLTFSMRSPSQMSSEKILRPQKRGWKRQKKEILKRWMSGKKKLKLIRKCWKTAKYLPCFTMIFLTPFRTEQHSAVSVPSFGRVNGNIRKIFPLECASWSSTWGTPTFLAQVQTASILHVLQYGKAKENQSWKKKTTL